VELTRTAGVVITAAELGDRQSHFEAARRHARAAFSLRGVSMSRAFAKETDDTFADVPEPAGSCRRPRCVVVFQQP
jgi:hypothetical protein